MTIEEERREEEEEKAEGEWHFILRGPDAVKIRGD